MKQEMLDVLESNILRFWLDKMQDHENGGFYGRIDGQGVLHREAEKGRSLRHIVCSRRRNTLRLPHEPKTI